MDEFDLHGVIAGNVKFYEVLMTSLREKFAQHVQKAQDLERQLKDRDETIAKHVAKLKALGAYEEEAPAAAPASYEPPKKPRRGRKPEEKGNVPSAPRDVQNGA